MITLSDYAGCWSGHKDWTPECQRNANMLLTKVNSLINDYYASGGSLNINPKTKSLISGETGGGFRPQDYPVGASKSTHKVGMGVDIYDLNGKFKKWLMANKQVLINHDLYMEDPKYTPSWLHVQSRPTKNRVFIP